MSPTRAHIVILIASLCFTQGYLKAAEQPRLNKFKVAAIVALFGVAGNVATNPASIDVLSSAGRSFAAGTTTCSLATVGASAGAYVTSHIAPENSGAIAGGSALGAGLGFATIALSRDDSVAFAAGCYCGGQMGIAAVHAALHQ